jgi:ABC superfamily ATP binding cassette transporter
MKKIQLKQVLRNKRFVLFTIILPIGWYIFFDQLQKGVSPSILLGIAVFIGVIGNSLATFSKRIASDIGFYSFESHFTSYSVKNYLWDQSIVQLILNSLIFLAVLVVAVLGFHFPVTTSLLVQFFLLSLMGIYFSVIGFVLGVRVDAKTIDTMAFQLLF